MKNNIDDQGTNPILTPIIVIGNGAIRATLDEECLRQILNARGCPGA